MLAVGDWQRQDSLRPYKVSCYGTLNYFRIDLDQTPEFASPLGKGHCQVTRSLLYDIPFHHFLNHRHQRFLLASAAFLSL